MTDKNNIAMDVLATIRTMARDDVEREFFTMLYTNIDVEMAGLIVKVINRATYMKNHTNNATHASTLAWVMATMVAQTTGEDEGEACSLIKRINAFTHVSMHVNRALIQMERAGDVSPKVGAPIPDKVPPGTPIH